MSQATAEDRERLMSLRELAEKSGVPPRTIRLYITRGLLMGPRRRGREACYGPEHLERLQEIRRRQSQGQTLYEIARSLAGETAAPAGEGMAGWSGYQLTPEVIVLVRAGLSPWRSRYIRNVLARMAAELRALDKEATDEERRG